MQRQFPNNNRRHKGSQNPAKAVEDMRMMLERRCLVGWCKEVGSMGKSLTTLKRWGIKVWNLEVRFVEILFEFERAFEANKVL